jgi:hypothetical protein
MNDLAADYDWLADGAAIKARGKSHQKCQAAPGVPPPTTTPRSDELTLSSIFGNKVAVPTLAYYEGRQTRLRHDMVDDRPLSGCEPESDCAAGTLPLPENGGCAIGRMDEDSDKN